MAIQFERAGLGYRMSIPKSGVEISVGRLSKSRGEYHGMLRISCAMPAVRSVEGVIFAARENLSSDASRKRISKALSERADGVDWLLALDDFCLRVLNAEAQGPETTRVGQQPQSLGVAWRLEPILPAGMTSILYGEGAAGKSTLAVAIGVSVQTGITVIPGWTPRPANVLYLDWETWADDVDAKVKGVTAGAGIGEGVSFFYRPCAMPIAEESESLANQIERDQIGLLIVDSAGLAAGTGDGDYADVAFRMFAAFREFGTTVLLIDHITKGDAADRSRPSKPYGSAYKGYLARCTYEVRRQDHPGNRSSLGVYPTKYNIGRKLPPVGLWVDQDDAGVVRYGREELSGELTKPLSQPMQIAAVLREGARPVAEIAELTDLPENVVRAVLSRDRGARFVKVGDEWGLLHAS